MNGRTSHHSHNEFVLTGYDPHLACPQSPVNAVSATSDERQRGRVLFERMIVLVANLWGRAWRGENLTSSEILRELHPAIVLFNRRQQETKDWLPWYELRRAAPDYFAFLIHMVSAHGPEALVALSEAFDLQWKDEVTRQYWQSAWKRRITIELYRAGDSAKGRPKIDFPWHRKRNRYLE